MGRNRKCKKVKAPLDKVLAVRVSSGTYNDMTKIANKMGITAHEYTRHAIINSLYNETGRIPQDEVTRKARVMINELVEQLLKRIK